MTFDGSDLSVIGKLQSKYTSGDEGGEFFLNKSETNTTLNTGVTVDVWQNRLRFFEQGGTARGAFIDISTMQAGVGTNLASYTYLTTAQRTALTPVKGQTVYDTDLGSLLIYYGATTGWRPPWNQPWGTLLLATDTTNRTYSTSPSVMTGFTGSVATVINRKYRTTITLRAYNAGAAGFFTLQPRVAGTTQNNFTGYTISTSFDQSFTFSDVYTETATSTRTFDIRASAASGTLSVTSANGRAVFTVEDIGPVTSTPPSAQSS